MTMTATLPTITKDFITAGKATFTLEIPLEYATQNNLKQHYTFKVTFKKGDKGFNDTYFVKLMTGADNEASYSYLGILNPTTGIVRTTAKSCLSGESLQVRLLNRTLALVWAGNTEALTAAGFNACHAGKCGRCGQIGRAHV